MELIYKLCNVLMESSDLKEIAEKILNYILHLFGRIDRGFSFSSLFSPHLPAVQPLLSRMHCFMQARRKGEGKGLRRIHQNFQTRGIDSYYSSINLVKGRRKNPFKGFLTTHYPSFLPPGFPQKLRGVLF